MRVQISLLILKYICFVTYPYKMAIFRYGRLSSEQKVDFPSTENMENMVDTTIRSI